MPGQGGSATSNLCSRIPCLGRSAHARFDLVLAVIAWMDRKLPPHPTLPGLGCGGLVSQVLQVLVGNALLYQLGVADVTRCKQAMSLGNALQGLIETTLRCFDTLD